MADKYKVTQPTESAQSVPIEAADTADEATATAMEQLAARLEAAAEKTMPQSLIAQNAAQEAADIAETERNPPTKEEAIAAARAMFPEIAHLIPAIAERVMPDDVPGEERTSVRSGRMVPVFNDETNSYELRPEEEVAAAEILSDPMDFLAEDPSAMPGEWHDARGQYMHPQWANRDPKWRGAESKLQYAPVRPADAPYLKRFYNTAKVEGLGECFINGDTVLMECPQRAYEMRERNGEARHKKDMREMVEGIDNELTDRASSVFGGEVALRSEYNNDISEVTAADLEADAEIDAEYELQAGGSARKVFGGLAGSPQYNKFQPTGPKRNYGYVPQ